MPLRGSTALTDNFQIKRFRREKNHIVARAGIESAQCRSRARSPGKKSSCDLQDTSRHRFYGTEFEGGTTLHRRIHPEGDRRRRKIAP